MFWTSDTYQEIVKHTYSMLCQWYRCLVCSLNALQIVWLYIHTVPILYTLRLVLFAGINFSDFRN